MAASRSIRSTSAALRLVESSEATYPSKMDESQLAKESASELPAPLGCVGIGGFWFHSETGELTPRQGGETGRLPPKPTRLLALLIEKRGAVASHQEIRELLWPDVEVDFEQGLHFCVRQVRAALGDSANEPRYVETLARRGYRLLVEVEVETSSSSAPASESPGAGDPPDPAEPVAEQRAASPIRGLGVLGLGIAAGVAALIAAIMLLATDPHLQLSTATSSHEATTRPSTLPEIEPPSLAIMSFRAPRHLDGIETHRIADLLLIKLGPWVPGRLSLTGPTTTEAYGTDLGAVHRFSQERPVDFVINGRFLVGSEVGAKDEEPRLIVELIQASDGAHLWVEVFEDLTEVELIAQRVADAIIKAMILPDLEA